MEELLKNKGYTFDVPKPGTPESKRGVQLNRLLTKDQLFGYSNPKFDELQRNRQIRDMIISKTPAYQKYLAEHPGTAPGRWFTTVYEPPFLN